MADDPSLAEDILETAAVGSGDTDSEAHVRQRRTEHEMDEHLDQDERTAVWTLFSLHDRIDSVEARQLPTGIDLVIATGDRTVHHPLTDATGFDREARAYIHGRAGSIHELYRSEPGLYDSLTVQSDAVEAGDHTPDDTDRIRLQTQLEANLETAARQGLWTCLDAARQVAAVTVTDLDDGILVEVAEERDEESFTLLAADATGYSPDERHYIRENVDDIVALYRADRTLYLPHDSRI